MTKASAPPVTAVAPRRVGCGQFVARPEPPSASRSRRGCGHATPPGRGAFRADREPRVSAPAEPTPPGLARRLAAIVYDALLLAGLWLIFTTATWVARGGREVAPGTLWFQLALVAVAGAFFGGFWTHGGQTVGMLAWKIRVERRAGGPLGWHDAAARFAAALVSWLPLGLGFWWALVDRDGLTWHDRLSGTRLVRIERGTAQRAVIGVEPR